MTAPRILMSASDDPMRLDSAYFRYLQAAGHDVHGWTAATAPTMQRPGLGDRVLRRLLPVLRHNRLGRDLLARVDAVKPDIVWLFKGMDIRPAVLRQIKAQGIKLVNYNADHPFEFLGRGSGNANVRASVGLYDLYITYSQAIAAEIRDAHPRIAAAAVIPFGHEVDDARLARLPMQPEEVRACFVGNPDAQRVAAITALAQAGVPVDVYGFDWPRHLSPSPGLRLFGPLHGDDMLAALRRYRVQLNVFRPHNAGSHNMRSFEVPAVGGIMLGQDSAEHRAFFTDGKEAFFYASTGDMISRAKHLLALPAAEAAVLRHAARTRTLTLNSHYANRAADAAMLLADLMADQVARA